MKKTTLTCCLMLAMALAGCSDKKAADPQNGQSNTAGTENTNASASETSDLEADADRQATDGQASLQDMGQRMRSSIINVPSNGNAKAGIREFARAYTQQFQAYAPNQALASYAKDPKAFKAGSNGPFINVNDKNGYARCIVEDRYYLTTEMCFWRRANGHSLVGVYLRKAHESNHAQYAYAFYDYDPSSAMMTPDMEVNDLVETTIKRFLTDDVTIELPQEGKDLSLSFITYKDREADDYDAQVKTLKWTGNGFRLMP